jgi:hypothetical protein
MKATFVRTVISAINLLSRAHFPSQVHSNTLQACLWLTTQLGEDAPTDGETRLLAMLPARPPAAQVPAKSESGS